MKRTDEETERTNATQETLVLPGTEVKALGNGKIGGFLVLFGDSSQKDLARDFFTPDTDFGTHEISAVLYHHGLDPVFKGRVLDSEAKLEKRDVGIWIEAQLEMRDEYEKAIYGMVKAGKLGWSSGTASHLVERKKVGNAFQIKRWPLGLDASLTPTPCEPRTCATTLKALAQEYEVKALGDFLARDMTMSALRAAHDALYNQLANAVWDESRELPERIADLRTAFDDCRDITVRVIKAMASIAPSDEQKAAREEIQSLKLGALTTLDFDDHSDMVLTACQEYLKRAQLLRERRARDGRIVSEDRVEAFKALRNAVDALLKASRPTPPPDTRALKRAFLQSETDILAALAGG